MRPIVQVRYLGKSYRLGHTGGRQRRVRDTIIRALSEVSFEVFPGEIVGIVGRNGAGKSTLLKILSRIVRPTSGEVDIYGRLGSLLEIGTGFHPDLTGRENVYFNGAIIGMSRSETRRKFDEIVAFAEVEEFLDTPVKHYSSGMYLRLAFAVAAHFEPEILILDEVLSVGDAAFQQKCYNKMQNIIQEGRTIFLVSHDPAAVQRLCRRGLLIESGRLKEDGPADTVVKHYLDGVTRTASG
jgi:homopolymeric O-antigen transport system ATP-binding protein